MVKIKIKIVRDQVASLGVIKERVCAFPVSTESLVVYQGDSHGKWMGEQMEVMEGTGTMLP